MVDLSPFQSGIEAAMREHRSFNVSDDPRSDFHSHLEKDGYRPAGQIVLNKVIRIQDPIDKPNKKTGWYWYSEFEMTGYVLGVGVYGSWRSGDRLSWSSKSQHLMGVEELVKYRAKMEQARLARDAEQEQIYNEAAKDALDLYNSSLELTGDHGYLTKKGIKAPPMARLCAETGALVLPILNENEQLSSVQKIFSDGFKKNFTGGKMKGAFFRYQGDDTRICICEGVATGGSIFEATGATVYCAMSANNLYEVTGIAKRKHPNADIVLCADDNSANAVNTGLNAAMQAADAFGARVISPSVPKDFNDQHQALGLQSVSDLIFPTKKKYECVEVKREAFSFEPPQGFLRDVYDYYNATSGNDQKGFAVQAAVGLASVVLGRRFKTDNGNFTSLFLLNIGKSATGKEHAKTVIYKILKAANQTHLMGGSGYTSEGAVVSAAINKPKHIAICDEFGRNIMAAKNSGDANFAGANSKLMEAIGACHSVMRPRNYSTMGIARDKADDLGRAIENPAITILAMSTPSTFFESIDHRSIADGFIGRFIISVSDAQRSIRRRVSDVEVPERIISWIDKTIQRSKSDVSPDVAGEVPPFVTLSITQDAWAMYETTAQYFIDQANALEEMKMDDFNNRSHEFVLRLGLICALSENPDAETVDLHHIEWAAEYIKASTNKILGEFKHFISGSEFEAKKKEALAALRKAGSKGMSLKDMNKRQPFAKWPLKDRKEILSALCEAELAFCEAVTTSGRAATVYFATGD